MTTLGAQEQQLSDPGFERFVRSNGAQLRRALVARFGVELGTELHAEAMEAAWADWPRLQTMESPSGYLWRVAQSRARRYRRWGRPPPFPGDALIERSSADERDLFLSLASLTDAQRVAVVLVHAHRATYDEVAQLLDVPVTTVTNLVHRALTKLRDELEESP